MNKEVMKQESNVPTNYTPSPSQVINSDVVIPKITLMQAMSDLVKSGKTVQGQMIRSSNTEVVGDEKNPFEFIPMTIKNDWLLSKEVKKGKFEFVKYEPRTNENEGYPWDYVEAGVNMKRTKILTVFALLPKDIEKEKKMIEDIENGDTPDVDGVLLPVAIQFKGSSFKSGRDISTLFKKAESISRTVGKDVPVYGTTMRLSCYEEANDEGSFYVYKTEPAGKTKEAYRKACASWYGIMNTAKNDIKVDESDTVKPQAFHADARPVDVGF